jgi:hypothetical protein
MLVTGGPSLGGPPHISGVGIGIRGADTGDRLTRAARRSVGSRFRPVHNANVNGVVRTRCALRVSLLRRSTAGGREYFACGEGLGGDNKSRRPDWFK